MTKFTVTDRQGQKREIEAHQVALSYAGALEFWRIGEHGKALISAIPPGFGHGLRRPVPRMKI
jgi:hypothetical protein